MAIKSSTFIAVETALTQRLVKALGRATAALYKQIEAAISKDDFELARKLVDSLSLDAVAEQEGEYLTHSTNLAMLFGASRVTPDPGTSVVGLGHEKMMVHQAVQSLSTMISIRAEEVLKDKALQLIALMAAPPVVVEKADRVIKDFASFMDDEGKAYFNLVSSLHTSRVSAYGFCAEATALGLDKYQINEQLDRHTCKVCRHMHGKVFEVRKAKDLLDVTLRVKDPNDLKHLQPWPSQTKDAIAEFKQLTSDQLTAQGWHIPPFHPKCRGLLARAGKAPSMEAVAQGTADNAYVTTAEDFKTVGLKVSPSQLAKWNSFAKMSPAEMLARMGGKALPDYLAGLVGLASGKDLAKYTGLTSFKLGATLAIKAKGPVYGSAKDVAQAVTFSPNTRRASVPTLSQEGSVLPPDLALSYLRGVVDVAQGMSMVSVATTAGAVLEEVHSVRAGFLPSVTAWNQLRVKLLAKSKTSPLWNKMLSSEKDKLIDALTDPDPKGLRVLLTSPEGLILLPGFKWPTTLDLKDPESMSMFLKAVKALP